MLPLKKLKRENGYTYLTSDYEGFPAGTVFYGSKVIYGYPHIPRVYRLMDGIKRNISEERFFVEEKIDGYNIRLAFLDGRILAFTRQGHLDAFATFKLSKLPAIKKFFEKHSDLVLCGELIGNTPFTKPTDKFDIKFFVFDIMRGRDFLTLDEKSTLVKSFSLPRVPLLGVFNKGKPYEKRIKALALGLHKEEKEGMVIKSFSRKEAIKFVTASSEIKAIEETTTYLFDLSPGFLKQRITRAFLFAEEFHLSKEELTTALGKAFSNGLQKALESLEKYGDIRQEFIVYLDNEEQWKEVEKTLSRSKEIRIADVYIWKRKKGIGVRFFKVYKKTTKLFKNFLAGKAFID